MKTRNWFEVSHEGLRELQEGKPKHFVARELIQNAWDEAKERVDFIAIYIYKRGLAIITVKDDSPQGFRDLADAFTLFGPTYKRSRPEKRGRFNLGEKQALAICDLARITTTKGTILFSKLGRKFTPKKTEIGSEVEVTLKMTVGEFTEMLDVVRSYRVPDSILFTVNGQPVTHREAIKTIQCVLPTEVLTDRALRRVNRRTSVDILDVLVGQKARLYEMGIPVCEIDCQYDLDVGSDSF